MFGQSPNVGSNSVSLETLLISPGCYLDRRDHPCGSDCLESYTEAWRTLEVWAVTAATQKEPHEQCQKATCTPRGKLWQARSNSKEKTKHFPLLNSDKDKWPMCHTARDLKTDVHNECS